MKNTEANLFFHDFSRANLYFWRIPGFFPGHFQVFQDFQNPYEPWSMLNHCLLRLDNALKHHFSLPLPCSPRILSTSITNKVVRILLWIVYNHILTDEVRRKLPSSSRHWSFECGYCLLFLPVYQKTLFQSWVLLSIQKIYISSLNLTHANFKALLSSNTVKTQK